ncbi:MAG: hypothetical protein RLY86_143 [Pseudomonadota bacterium]|jgi:hypothetical protein
MPLIWRAPDWQMLGGHVHPSTVRIDAVAGPFTLSITDQRERTGRYWLHAGLGDGGAGLPPVSFATQDLAKAGAERFIKAAVMAMLAAQPMSDFWTGER